MARRPPAQARFLGLWTASWLFVLLLAGVLWVGELRLQWPVLVVPALWAAWALRPRRGVSAGSPPFREPPPRSPATRQVSGLPRVPPSER